MSETTRHFVGVDLHKTILQVCVLDADGELVDERRFRGESLEQGLAAVEWMARWRDGGRFCVEALANDRLMGLQIRRSGKPEMMNPVAVNFLPDSFPHRMNCLLQAPNHGRIDGDIDDDKRLF